MSNSHNLTIPCSQYLTSWLLECNISLAFTTYQTNRLFLIGCQPDGNLSIFERLFDRPMGLYATADKLYLSTRYQLWQFNNVLAPGQVHNHCYDKLYVPCHSYITGDINVHDVVVDETGDIIFVNTEFSCLAKASNDYSFEVIWQPPFISQLNREDRCHLNGLAIADGKPAYVTACSRSDIAAGWRHRRVGGGVVIDVASSEIIAAGLSMPHSPRWYRDKLWVLNSGSGELGYVDLDKGQFQAVAFCPGFIRGLAFYGDMAIVGLSKPRHQHFQGLPLEKILAAKDADAVCGLYVINLTTGNLTHWLELDGIVKELFDVVVLPEVKQPMALGFKTDEIQQLVTYPGGIILPGVQPDSATNQPNHSNAIPTKDSVLPLTREVRGDRPKYPVTSSLPDGVHKEGLRGDSFQGGARGDRPKYPVTSSLPPLSRGARGDSFQSGIKGNRKYRYQMSVNLGVAAAVQQFGQLAFPPLAKIATARKINEPLIAIIANYQGQLVGLAIAEIGSDRLAEVLSFAVVPEHRQQGVGTKLLERLTAALNAQGVQSVLFKYWGNWNQVEAIEKILGKVGFSVPKTHQLLYQVKAEECVKLPWLSKYQLPQDFSIFPWDELTAEERDRLMKATWYPPVLTPFQEPESLEPLNSLGLRYQGEVVGWCITHRIAEDTIQYSSLFMQPKFQTLGRGIMLLAESLKRQLHSDVPNCIWRVDIENQKMLEFGSRRLAPCVFKVTEHRYAVKVFR